MSAGRLTGLDGLRGVAAIGVMLLHAHISFLPFRHGYLAVDLFFMLSGFVIARSYEPVLKSGPGDGGMNAAAYMMARLGRLYPMLLLGGLLGLLVYSVGLSDFVPSARGDLAWAVASQFLLLSFLSPVGFFAFNAVQWSIVAELVVNAAHAIMLPRLRIAVLGCIVCIAALGLVVNGDRCGTIQSDCAAVLPGLGWSRAFYGFFAGVLLCRLQSSWWPLVARTSFVLLAIVLLALLDMLVASTLQGAGRWIYDLVCVVFIFPLIVMLGVKAKAGAFAAALGTLSYPLYAIHFPILNALRKLGGTENQALLTMALLVPAAWLIGRWVDEPLNGWRRRRRHQRRAAIAPPDTQSRFVPTAVIG